MRPDQLQRLNDLRERLIEQALSDSDPENWVGGTKTPAEMTRDERGDAKWSRNVAVQTVTLAMQVQRLARSAPAVGAPEGADVGDADGAPIDKEIKRYEAAAAAVLKRARERTAAKR